MKWLVISKLKICTVAKNVLIIFIPKKKFHFVFGAIEKNEKKYFQNFILSTMFGKFL
tara:strand:+ start:1881 stop:2051 length:171 start_codon:yes stop_codon:yes gene_type:complete